MIIKLSLEEYNMQLSNRKKQVFLLYGSSVVGLLVGVLNSVLNTRVLSPELYGDVRYVQNIIQDYFNNNNGKEFIRFQQPSFDNFDRVCYYHFSLVSR